MTLQIELTPEVEAGLTARAAAQGVSLTEYVQQFLEQSVPLPVPSGGNSPGELALAFREWADRFPYSRTTPIPDDALRRENLYGNDD